MFLDKEGFCKEGVVLKTVSNKDKDKTSKGLVRYIKV
jgi:hypothetical protein